MEQVNIFEVLSTLDEDSYKRIRTKFKENKDKFVNLKQHKMANPLLGVLCEDKMISLIDPLLLSRIIKAIFTDLTFNPDNLSKYCDSMVRALGNLKQNSTHDARISRYADYLTKKLIPTFKKTVSNAEKANDYLIPLSFIYKISACIYRSVAHNECAFSLSVNRETMSEFGERVYGLSNVFGLFTIDKSYALLLSWILEEFICAQDGIEEE